MHITPPSLALLFLLASPMAAPAQALPEPVVAVENHYSGLTGLTARVAQKNFLKSVGKTQKFDAVLRIKKPGKLRLDYTNGQVILVNGKDALFYSKKSGQAIKKTFTDFQQMNIPVAFLLGAAHIRDDFTVLPPDPKAPRALDLAPRKQGAAMKKMRLELEDTGRITGLVIHDASGNMTEIAFSGVEENVALDDSLFVFKPPKGTEIIEQ